MKYVTIRDHDERGRLVFDLIDILKSLGDEATRLRWSVRNAEVTGHRAEELHRLSDLGIEVGGPEVLKLASEVTQTIDGEFIGRLEVSHDPEIVIRAVDSSYFDVLFHDPRILQMLRRRFRSVSELKEWPSSRWDQASPD